MPLPNDNMDFTPFDILTAAELDDLVENIESLADGTGFDTGAIGTSTLADSAVTFAKTTGIWWEEIARTNVASSQSSVTLAIPAKKYLLIRISVIPSAVTQKRLQFNGDTGSNYRSRYSSNGAADTDEAAVSSGLVIGNTNSEQTYSLVNIVNIANQEKLMYASTVQSGVSGSANPTSKLDISGKWTNTSNQITSITLNGSGSGIGAGTEVVVLGHD